MSETPELPEAKAVKLSSAIAAARPPASEKKEPAVEQSSYDECDSSFDGAASFLILLVLLFLAFAPFVCNARFVG